MVPLVDQRQEDTVASKHSRPPFRLADAADDELITEAQTAEHYKVATWSLQRWRSQGVGPPFVKIGGVVRYRAGTIREYDRSQIFDSATAARNGVTSGRAA